MKKLSMPDLRGFSFRSFGRKALAAAEEGWYVAGDRRAQDRARLLGATYTSNIIANMIGGSFWTGLLLYMGATDAFIGSMSMIGTAANMLQIFAPLLLERFPRRKTLIMVIRSLIMLLNVVVIGLIPIFPVAQQMRLTMFSVTVLVINLFNAAISPGISIWHLQSIPQRVRTSFYSLITMTNGVVVCVFNLLGSKVVDAFKASGQEYAGLMALRVFALALVALDMYFYSRVKEYPYESSVSRFSIRDLFTLPFKEKKYLKTILVTCMWHFAANIPASYPTVYLLKNIGIEYSFIMTVSFINVPIVLFLTPLWRRVLTRYGWFKTLYIGMAIYILNYILFAFTTTGTIAFYVISAVIAYFGAIGINLSFTGIAYYNIPAKNQTVFLGFYSTVANFVAFLGIGFGRYFIEWTENLTLNILGMEMVNKQYLMLLTSALMVVGIFIIYWVNKTTPREE